MGIKKCTSIISKFVCDICQQADEIKTDRNEFLKYIISNLFDMCEKDLSKLDISTAYTDNNIIKDFIITANAIYESQKEKADTDGLGCIIATRSDGREFKILMGFTDNWGDDE